MKNSFKASVMFGILFVGLVLLAGIQLRATAVEVGEGRNLDGTWITSVTQVDCVSGAPVAPVFPGILSFHHGGTMSGTSAVAPAVFGTWDRSGAEFRFAGTFLRYNSSGAYVGRQTIRQKVTLGQGGGEFTSSGSVEILDTNGNVIGNGCATSIGIRFE